MLGRRVIGKESFSERCGLKESEGLVLKIMKGDQNPAKPKSSKGFVTF